MAIQARIGFISPRSAASSHYRSFKELIPSEVQMDFHGLELVGSSLYELKGKKDEIVKRAAELQKQYAWQGMIFSGAPVEVLNPGFFDDLRAAIQLPFTTALAASVAALKAYRAEDVLLLTPFDEPMNRLIREHLERSGVAAVSAAETLGHYTDALKMGPEKVYDLTQRALADHKNVDALYFQGAVLDPLPVLEKIEKELRKLIVASNPAMLWSIASRLGLKFQISGYGRLLQEWPKIPA